MKAGDKGQLKQARNLPDLPGRFLGLDTYERASRWTPGGPISCLIVQSYSPWNRSRSTIYFNSAAGIRTGQVSDSKWSSPSPCHSQ